MTNRACFCCWLLVASALLHQGGCGGSNAANRTSAKTTAQWIADGDKLLADAQLEDALAAFDSAVDADPASAEARQRRALAYLRLGKPDKAVDDCDAALRQDAKLTDAYYTRGEAEKQLGATDKAAADFSRALDRSPDRADVLAARGKLYQQMAAADRQQSRKLLDDALKDFDKALKNRPSDTTCLQCRAEILLDTGDYQAAIDDCDKALAIDHQSAEARVARARALIGKGDFDKAVADCTAAIEADGTRLDAYVVRADARIQPWHDMRSVPAVAECSKAVDDCAKAISLSGQLKGNAETLRRGKKWLAVVHELCGNLYEALRAPAKALDEYSAAISMDPDLTDALVRRALNRGSRGDFVAALADCNQAVDMDRTRPEGYYGRGMIFNLQGQFTEAERELNEAAARNYAKAYGGLATVYFNMANAELRKLRGSKDQAELAAAGERINGYRQKSIDSATKELESNRRPLPTRLLRGLANADSRRFDAAYEDLSEVIHDDPLATKAYFYRGVVCAMASQQAASTKIVQLQQASIKDFTRAIQLQPNYAMAYKNRGDVYHVMGNEIAANSDYATFAELRKQFKDEQNQAADRPDELLAKPQQQSAGTLGPEFQPLIAAWKEIEKKLDGVLKK